MLDIDIFFIYNKTLNTLIQNVLYPVLEKKIIPLKRFFKKIKISYFICLLIFEDGFSLQF